jgi:hypothetical protein
MSHAVNEVNFMTNALSTEFNVKEVVPLHLSLPVLVSTLIGPHRTRCIAQTY